MDEARVQEVATLLHTHLSQLKDAARSGSEQRFEAILVGSSGRLEGGQPDKLSARIVEDIARCRKELRTRFRQLHFSADVGIRTFASTDPACRLSDEFRERCVDKS